MNTKKEITIYDIARHLNVSTATVSRALKDHPAIKLQTKARIVETARAMGYQTNTFARYLRNKRTNTIGVIVPKLNSMFMSEVLAGMEEVISNSGYQLIIIQSLELAEKEISGVHTMFEKRVDGLLVSLSYNTDNLDHFEPFINKKTPLIFFDRVEELDQCPTIVIDNFKAAYDLTCHLISCGCKHIVHITGSLNRNVYRDRLNGFKQALSEHGLMFRSEHLIVNDLSPESGQNAASYILSLPQLPDGIFASNDLCAINCMRELKEHGVKIPEDIKCAGFNNDFVASLVEPGLTTVDYKGYEMGKITAQTLINQLTKSQNFEYTQTIVIRHEIIIRNSTV